MKSTIVKVVAIVATILAIANGAFAANTIEEAAGTEIEGQEMKQAHTQNSLIEA